jgi:hypothetical protein
MKIYFPSYKITGAATQCRAQGILAGWPRRAVSFELSNNRNFGRKLGWQSKLVCKKALDTFEIDDKQ